MSNYSHSEQAENSPLIYMVLKDGKKIAAKEETVLSFIENNYDFPCELDDVEIYEWCRECLDTNFESVMQKYYQKVICTTSEFKSANREQRTIREVACK